MVGKIVIGMVVVGVIGALAVASSARPSRTIIISDNPYI